MNNRMYEICGNCGKRYGLHIDISCPDNFNSVFEPTGKYEGENMSDKIQMTEEQSEKMMFDCFDFEQGWEKTKSNLHKKGYIIKSELQRKVEEAEEMYRIYSEEPATEFDKKYSCDVEVSEFLINVSAFAVPMTGDKL